MLPISKGDYGVLILTRSLDIAPKDLPSNYEPFPDLKAAFDRLRSYHPNDYVPELAKAAGKDYHIDTAGVWHQKQVLLMTRFIDPVAASKLKQPGIYLEIDHALIDRRSFEEHTGFSLGEPLAKPKFHYYLLAPIELKLAPIIRKHYLPEYPDDSASHQRRPGR